MPVSVKPEPHGVSAPTPADPQRLPQPSSHGLAPHGASAANGTQPSPSSRQPCSAAPGTTRTSQLPQPAASALPRSTVMQPSNKASTEAEAASAVSEDAIDYHSVRGVFGWATLDDINIPYIIRKYRKFVAVRIVEKKVLNKYPNSFPDELGRKEPLVSYFVTEAEASLLNEINTIHCSFDYGHQPFTTKDLIVDLVEFEDFYKLVKKTFPEEVLASITAEENSRPAKDDKNVQLSKRCGWMQINNTVTPYIIRSSGKFVPLSVIQYAAQLLTKDQVEGHLPTLEECNLLNETCKAAGFEFVFGRNTKLLHIAEVMQRCTVRISELPFENPLQHAQYIESLNQAEMVGAPPPPPPSVIAGGMALPFQSKPGHSEGPPNQNPFTGYSPFMSMMDMVTQASVQTPSPSVPRSTSTSSRGQPAQTQTAPLFFPPGPAVSGSRVPHLSANSLMSQAAPPAAGIHPRHQSTSPQVRSPVGHSPGLPPQFAGRGGVGAIEAGQFASMSSLSSRLPPPVYPGAPSPRHPPHLAAQLPVSSPSATTHRGSMTHPYSVAPHLVGQAGDVMVPGLGAVSRGATPMMGYPTFPDVAGLKAQQSQPPQSLAHARLQQPPPRYQASSAGTAHMASVGGPIMSTTGSPYPVQLNSGKGDGHSSSRQPPDDHIKLVGDIKAEMVQGKSISCMMRNSPERKGSFCLVEAVAKLYFPRCNLPEFVHALQNVLRIPLPVCTEQEAKAFIHFYNLPVNKLNDNHMISLHHLNGYFPQISYMFRHTAAPTVGKSPSALGRRTSASDGPMKLASPSTPITVVLNNNDSGEVINLDSGPPTPHAGGLGKRRVEGDGGAVVGGSASKSVRQDEVDGSAAKGRSRAVTGATGQVIVID